jgi:tRNA(fMet)-specific endonuclease VapC
VSRYLLDTDTFSLYLRHNDAVVSALVRHAADPVAVSVITVQELWDGWRAILGRAKTPDQVGTAYTRLTETLNELRNWPVVTFSAAAVGRYAALKKLKLNVGANDLKIAAIAIESGAVVVTHNRRDFERVPGLSVEDWAA